MFIHFAALQDWLKFSHLIAHMSQLRSHFEACVKTSAGFEEETKVGIIDMKQPWCSVSQTTHNMNRKSHPLPQTEVLVLILKILHQMI